VMHLGIIAKAFPRPTLEETLDAIVGHGIWHVQFNMSCAGLPTLPEQLDEDFCVWIARSFRQRELNMSAISGTFNLCDPNTDRLEHNLDRLDKLAAACRWLDTRIITLCMGTRHPEDMWRWHPENIRRSTWEILIQSLRRAVAIADKHEVTLAFEPEVNNVVSSVMRARRILDEIDSPWLKVVIDPANLFRPGEQRRMGEVFDEAFDWLGQDIVLAHAKSPSEVLVPGEISAIRAIPMSLNMMITMTTGQRAEELGKAEEISLFYKYYFKWLHDIKFFGQVIIHGLPENLAGEMRDLLTDNLLMYRER
jgi:sugar phosphate isomerase/epimerase